MSIKKKGVPIKKAIKKPKRFKLNEKGAVVLSDSKLLKAKRKSVRITVCDEAKGAVYGPRNKDYGSVTDNFGMTAKMWSAILGVNISAKDVGLCMVALKVSREKFCSKRDNLVDIAGYAATLEKLGLGE